MVKHEALLALLGHTGALIVEGKDGAFAVGDRVDFLVDHEKALLQRIAVAGHTYVSLDRFVRAVREDGSWRDGTPVTEGLYLRALCTGLDEVLDVYRSMILSAERAILDDPTLPLTYLVSRTADFELLLPALLRLSHEVEEQKVHGCKLLDLISQHACSGVPLVHSCAQRILARCFMVLYAQVSAWAVYGMLSDPHAEFCVRPAPSKHRERKGTVPEAPATSRGAGADTLHAAGYADDQSYILNPEMKPSVISATVAEKILFCGVAMRVVMHPKAHADDQPEPHAMAQFNDKMKKLAGALEFHRASFEGLIDQIHTYLSRRLWSLVVERARLPKHLRAVKDYFLLARGDLFQAFIDNTRGLLALPPSDTLDHDVNEPFRRAALLAFAEDDEFFARTRLAVEHPDTAADARRIGAQAGEEEEGLDQLRMHLEMEWPLGTLLFTPDVMAKYNELFSFLLRVKRAKTELQQAWLQTQSGRNGRAISRCVCVCVCVCVCLFASVVCLCARKTQRQT
jgi:gamma-tubulin complex component 4